MGLGNVVAPGSRADAWLSFPGIRLECDGPRQRLRAVHPGIRAAGQLSAGQYQHGDAGRLSAAAAGRAALSRRHSHRSHASARVAERSRCHVRSPPSYARYHARELRRRDNRSLHAQGSSGGFGLQRGASERGPHEHQPLHRLELSALHVAGGWSTSFVWGANVPTDTRRLLNTALIETNIELDGRNAIFGRAEYVTRTAEELALVAL